MDKRIVGVVGAISGLAALDPAQAAVISPTPTGLPAVTSFAELLDAIPNAVALLQAVEAVDAALAEVQSDVGLTLVGSHHHHRARHHHHHHHHRVRHHHHHHHHRARHHHHHHHHHHH